MAKALPGKWRPTLQNVGSVGAVLLLVHLARAKDVFADFTRPTVTFALRLVGIAASDHGDTISVGRLEVPWTRDCADVLTDGGRWMREFYLLNDQLLPNYPAYLKQTFVPRSSPGVHLIFVAQREAVSADAFNELALGLAARLHEKCIAQTPAA